MIYMTHYCNYRRSVLQILFSVCKILNSFFNSFFLHSSCNYIDSQFFCEHHHGIFIDILVYISHYSKLHQAHYYL